MAIHAVWPWTVRLSLSTSHKPESLWVTVVVVAVLSTLGIAYSSAEREAKTTVRMRRIARTIFVPFTVLEYGGSLP